MKHILSTILRYALPLGLAILGTIFLFWIYSPPKEALSVSPQPIPVLTETVKKDGTCAALGFDRCVVLKLTRCKNTDAKGRVVITLVSNKTRLTLPVGNDNGERKCDNNLQLPLPIPPQTAPDTYHINFRATYKINPIITLTQDFDTEEFNVE